MITALWYRLTVTEWDSFIASHLDWITYTIGELHRKGFYYLSDFYRKKLTERKYTVRLGRDFVHVREIRKPVELVNGVPRYSTFGNRGWGIGYVYEGGQWRPGVNQWFDWFK